MIDLYCERAGPGLLAEPVNAFSNVAFFVAAWAAWSLARRAKAGSSEINTLLALMLAIAIGSTLFHTLATGWARVLDELPILVFQLLYIWVYLRRVLAMRAGYAASAIVVYLLAAFVSRQYPHLANGSLVYAPALLVLPVLGVCHFVRREPGRWLLLAAAGVFFVSVICRSVDKAACDIIPFGTHFLWHVLNSVVLYLSMRALAVNPGVARRGIPQ